MSISSKPFLPSQISTPRVMWMCSIRALASTTYLYCLGFPALLGFVVCGSNHSDVTCQTFGLRVCGLFEPVRRPSIYHAHDTACRQILIRRHTSCCCDMEASGIALPVRAPYTMSLWFVKETEFVNGASAGMGLLMQRCRGAETCDRLVGESIAAVIMLDSEHLRLGCWR